MPDDLLIARNPEEDSTLPYLVRIPLGQAGIVVKARQTWPREAKIYCHRAESWPLDADIVERLEVRSCTRRGAAIDLVLARARENRSQFVITFARGREMIFWQSPRTSKQARPGVHIPSARAHGQVLEILIDTGEKYPYRFGHQQATTSRQRLSAGDYAVALEGQVVAAVERKSADDLSSTLLSGRMTYLMADLAALPRAAVVVEQGYSKIFKLAYAPGAQVAEGLAEVQARFPTVPIAFCETRQLAAEWTYRWLGACLHELSVARGTSALEETFAAASDALFQAQPRTVTAARIRAWARSVGLQIPAKGRIPAEIRQRFDDAHG
ncbi:MAG: Lsr2 family protein [Propionibacteriaceae bacterium]|nr:Lsr2 family protein [Propionibacteriaceae bacterium]